MKLRKLMALGMAGVMAFSLAACGGGGSEEPAADNGNAAEADGGEEAAAGDVNKSIAYIVGNSLGFHPGRFGQPGEAGGDPHAGLSGSGERGQNERAVHSGKQLEMAPSAGAV